MTNAELIAQLEAVNKNLANASVALERVAVILERWNKHYVPVSKVL